MIFQILEELQKCKRISKSDRLVFRERIKGGDEHLIGLVASLPLDQLQKVLRTEITKNKRDKQNEKVRVFIEENMIKKDNEKKKVMRREEGIKEKIKKRQYQNGIREEMNGIKDYDDYDNQQIRETDRLPEEPFEIFKGKQAESVMKYFFIGEPKINRQTFIFRLQEYAKSQGYYFTCNVLNSYFELLLRKGISSSIQKKQLDISTFGDSIQPYVIIVPNKIRNLFTKLDREKWGYVSRYCQDGPQWLALFNRANYNKRPTISYWQLYAIRNTSQYLLFQQWYQSK